LFVHGIERITGPVFRAATQEQLPERQGRLSPGDQAIGGIP
jgi:hypothetical protein